MDTIEIKIKVGKFLYPLKLKAIGGHFELNFRYNKEIIEEIKAMDGAKYHGYDEVNPKKIWTIKNNPRNIFQLTYLGGGNPYARYDAPLIEYPGEGNEYVHQLESIRHGLTRKQFIWAEDMGLGKTLSMIKVMEASGCDDWFWIGPKSALYAVQLEFEKWKAKIRPRFYTYDSLRKLIETWPKDKKPPQGVVFDEASRCKNPAAQRSQAALMLANMCRMEYKDKAYIALLSGTPAPKSPLDWWSLCEIACPGYLKEGNIHKFQKRLAIIDQKESITGGVYPHHVSWKDDKTKCNVCGKFKTDPCHDIAMGGHTWIESKNEIEFLYERMKGLVLVKMKKDCLDLPDKRYITINLTPTPEIARAASLIVAKSPTTIQALTLLRELSDGFQYKEELLGEETCPVCKGLKMAEVWIDLDNPELPLDQQSIQLGRRVLYDDAGTPTGTLDNPLRLDKKTGPCEHCNATGVSKKLERTVVEIPTPKEDALKDLLDQFEESGRFITYAGFTGSIERCIKATVDSGWNYIRVDGRGWFSDLPGGPIELLGAYANKEVEKINFIAQPGAGGMGLNLTASQAVCYYSNDFNAESRQQSEDRAYRIGMQENGGLIYDLIHLPVDKFVLDNLKMKRRLQDMSLGQLKDAIK